MYKHLLDVFIVTVIVNTCASNLTHYVDKIVRCFRAEAMSYFG